MKHTPEPWHTPQGYSSLDERAGLDFIPIWCDKDYIVARISKEHPKVFEANANRIVECVNAMASVKNPEEFMKFADECATRLENTFSEYWQDDDVHREMFKKYKKLRGLELSGEE